MADLDPMSQVQVEQAIRELSRRLSAQTVAFTEATKREAEFEVTYKVAYAKTVYASEAKTAVMKEAEATIATEFLFMDYKLAAAEVKASTETGKNLREQLGAVRSINANVRDAVSHSTGLGS